MTQQDYHAQHVAAAKVAGEIASKRPVKENTEYALKWEAKDYVFSLYRDRLTKEKSEEIEAAYKSGYGNIS